VKKARVWIGILISIIALFFAFRQVDFGGVWAALVGANGWLLAASLIPLILFLIMRAVRWRMLFYPKRDLSLRNLLAVINIGYMLSNVFPARLGDVARAYLIGDTEDVSRAAAFSTIVAERVLDALCAVAGLFIVLPFADLPRWMVRAGSGLGIGAAVAVVLFVALVKQRTWTLRLLDRVLRALRWPEQETMLALWQRLARRTGLRFLARLPSIDRSRIIDMTGSLIDGFSGLATLRRGPALLLWSAALWAVISGYYWLTLLAFDTQQPYVAGLAVSSVTALGMAVPASPGFIGVFEFFARETMVSFGMKAETALSYALVSHAITYVFLSVAGLLSMVQQNLTYADIQERIAAEAQTPS
jgi:uncharacterized membrane protein YbhN (UPF0104 family)